MSGFDAADFLIGDYYIWARVIQNLADVGYDTNRFVILSPFILFIILILI